MTNPLGGPALVVEGGAMRSIFAAGVLDAFLETTHRPYTVCYGVSAGTTALAAWIAGQHGRTRRVIMDLSCRPEFIDLPRFLRGGDWLDLDWLWEISLRTLPFDMSAFVAADIPLWMVTTRISDGQPCYFRAEPPTAMHIAKASCSVPIACRQPVNIDGELHTDGGVGDSIPVIHAWQQGARDITVILSRPLGYRKQPSRWPALLRYWLRAAPALADAMLQRFARYNAALDFIANPPTGCRVRVIAPPANFRVGRLTRDQARLAAGYRQGHEAGVNVARHWPA